MRHKFLKVAALLVTGAFTMNAWAQTDVTSQYLTNAGFDDSGSWQASNVAIGNNNNMKDVANWTKASTSSWTGSATFGYGTDGQCNGSKVPSTNPEGEATGGAFGFSASWSGKVQYTQTVTLPAGEYTLAYKAYNAQTSTDGNNKLSSNLIGFVPSSGSAYYANKTTFASNSWIEDKVSFTLTSETTGDISIGANFPNASSSNTPRLFIDGITLTYTDLLAAAKAQLESEIAIAKGTEVSEAGESILDAAIQAAESTLASATTEEALLNAVTTLRVAINKAKLAGASYATPSVELLVNGTFDTDGAAWVLTNMGYQKNGERPTRYVEKWSGSALSGKGSATQTIKNLPAGAYLLTGYATANRDDATNVTLAVNGTSCAVVGNWKFYEILYNHEADGDITVTFSYDNTNANWVTVDELSLVYGGEYNAFGTAMYKPKWNTALNTAKTTATDVNVAGVEKTNLQNEINKAEPNTADGYIDAIAALEKAEAEFKAAKKYYDALAKNIAVAKSLGMAEATANGYAATATSTAAEALANTNNLKVAEYALIKETYDQNVNLSTWDEGFAEDLDGEGYKADGETYFNEWNGGNVTRTAKQTVKLPAGDYAISCIARGPEGTSGFLYYKAGENCDTTNFYMKGNRGLGVDTEGNANFTPATDDNGITYNCNNEGYGWEYYFLSLHLDKETNVEIGISASFSNAWVSMYAPKVMTTEASIKAVHLTTIESLLAEAPTGAMNATVKSNLDAKVVAAKAATDQNTIDELATIASELRDAVVEAKLSAEAYIKLNDYITRAKAFDATAVAPYEAKYNNGEYVNDDVTAVQQELNVISYNVVANSFANSVDLGEWNSTGEGSKAADFNNEHWSGEKRSYKNQYDGEGQGYNANAWKIQFDQEVVLPAGEYVFKVAGRKSADATLELVVSMGETVLGTVNDFPNGSTGLGINKIGAASFDANDAAGFARNEGTGFGWQWRYVKFTLAAKDTVKIAVNAKAESKNQWVSFGDYTLQMGDATYMAVYTPTYNAYLEEAKALSAMAMGNEEKAALEKVINENQTVPTTPATLKAQSDALKAAIETAKPSADAYAWIYNSIENAKTFGIEVAEYEAKYASRAYTIAQADTVHQELNVATYNKVATDYTNEYALTDWSTDELGTTTGQHWSGHGDTKYYDTNGSNFTRSTVKTVTLPKGSFVLKAAGRSSTAAKLTLDVNGTMVEFHAKGDVGYGIDTLGVANFSKNGIYANDNKGRGWEWQFVKFSLDEQTEVTLKATISAGKDWAWGSMGDVSLWMDDATFEGMLIAAKSELTAEIANAEALSTANVGDGAFQILSTDANLKTLKNAIATAKMLCESDLATTDMVLAGIPTLKQAEETYKATISTAKLNAPAANEKFNLVLTYKGWDYDGKAMTYIANDRSDAGKYNIKYAAAPNASYAQAFTFTPAESATNGYYLSMTDVDGNERYMSTGTQYSGQAAQIRTTTDATKALIVQVRATATEGVYNLWNTEAKQYIGSQDAGVYTVNSHIDFNFVAAEEAEVTVDITIGYATLMLPFNAELPAGMKAYTCVANADEAILTLTEVETLVANTPYLVEGEGSFEFSGYGLAAKATYVSEALTGTYAEVAAPVDSYVLQQLDGYTAFYHVAKGKQPKVGANHCYLTVPAGTAKAPMFSISRGEDTTSIDNSQFTIDNSQLIIYDLMGRKVTNMVKGNMYIVNGKKVIVK